MPCFADEACALTTELVVNERLAKDTMRLRVVAPEAARCAVPGQFFMIRLSGCNDPLIGRAFALYEKGCDEAGQASTIDLAYLVKGKFTSRLAKLQPGAAIDIWGPLGNGFSTTACDHLIMVAGGIGQTPMLAAAREALGATAYGSPARSNGYAKKVTFCYGARNVEYFSEVEQFESLGVDLRRTTDDGSYGPPRRVTDALIEVLEARSAGESTRIICCGPEPMMEAVAHTAAKYATPCEVSLETPMACGIGICFTCVAKIGTQDDWDYKRTCVEGPVFDASQVVW